MRLAGLALGLAFCQTKTDKAVMYVCMEAGLDPSSALVVVVVVDECIGALEKRDILHKNGRSRMSKRRDVLIK